MSPRPSHTDRNRVREGLSFAFPMQLPPSGTGAGANPAKAAPAKPGRQETPKSR
ncbi:MAG: hypothetical protein KDA31_07665 [Phycisphaerales bacterium]|nr:hypothetical protein [Phycisphaerales bacterium]MCB9836097.1 hypothetical protein [Phycisphaera sp.]